MFRYCKHGVVAVDEKNCRPGFGIGEVQQILHQRCTGCGACDDFSYVAAMHCRREFVIIEEDDRNMSLAQAAN